jgi:glutathionylspermidine amidase/synthetase
MTHLSSLDDESFGVILGYTSDNVAVYSCNYDVINATLYPDRHAFRHYIGGFYMGYKWQCVEFARRWLYLCKGYLFADVAMAYDIFRLHSVRTIKGNQLLPLNSFENGSKREPLPGSMLIWDEGGMFEETGHVAIITRVEQDKVYIAEQNVFNHKWPDGQDYSRVCSIQKNSNGEYWISCTFEDTKILGWVIQTEDATFAFDDPLLTINSLNFSLHEVDHKKLANKAWLDNKKPDEAAYIKYNGHKLASDSFFHYRYFSMSSQTMKEIKRATNELHAMFMHATDEVLNNEKWLSHFNIPEILWPRIKQSWANRHTETIAGRLDLAVGEQGIKCFEYNADSASCLMECGKVQGLWAKSLGVQEGVDAGNDLFNQLIYAWKKNDAGVPLHIMLDVDPEENYHAQYMQFAAEKAGIRCKFLKGLEGVRWGKDNSILDDDGEPIVKVWKTWAWETALDQLREQLADQEFARLAELTNMHQVQPRLVDVLLNPNVMVHEPLWTLIPSNKAILPILTALFPDSPYLLESRFELNDSLESTGYVEKPIVGRCGANITLYNPDNEEKESTQGRFNDQSRIYQQLCTLPQEAEYYIQTNAFVVDGKYAGTCLRVDRSPILTGNSDLPALRIMTE